MKWHKHSDALGWSEGHEGKGYLLRNGVIRHWNIDPYNPEDHQTVHQRNLETSPIGLKFEVDPDGGIVTDSPTPKVESIVAADPRLYDAGQRPEGEFELGELEPKKDAGPDYNFINSKWDLKEAGSWDPTVCENCGAPMGEPRLQGNRWVNSCTHCRMTRDVPTSNPLLKQWNQNWPPYPDLLQEVAQPRPWIESAWGLTSTSYPIANQVMYHVSPRRNRESILNEGLQGFDRGRREQSPWEYTWDQPPGNYLFDNADDAHDYIYNVHSRHHDITKEPDIEDMYEYPDPPEDFYQWPEEEQDEWHMNAEPTKRTDDPNGYDIHRVDARGLPIAPDPEATVAFPSAKPWDLGRIHDAYEERQGEDPLMDSTQLHNEVGSYYGQEPKRYYVPQDIHPSRIQLEQHVPSWNLNEEGLYEGLEESSQREYPQPWAQIPFTERPMPGHESATSPSLELQEWLADMGQVDPPSIHHETEEDMALRPQVTPQEGLSYYPPGHVPDQYKQAHESFDERPYLPCPECGGPMEYSQDHALDYNMQGLPEHVYSCHDCGHEVDDLPFTGNPDVDHHIYRGVYSRQSDILQPQPVPSNQQPVQKQGPRDVQETVHTQIQEALQRGDTEMVQWLTQFYSPHQQLMGFPPMMASKEAAAPKFDPTQPMPTGLPRPFDEVPMTEQWGELGIRPVPWSQAGGIDEAMSSGETRWGVPNTYRLEQAENNSLCLVCGEPVTDGAVFIDMVNDMTASKLKAQYTQADLPWVLDRGPLHTRCAALTAAHCPDIKKGLAGGQYVQKPYLAQMENPQGTIPVQSAKTAGEDPIGDWESEGGTVGSTKTADSPINQADATNDPLGKPAVLEPSKKGDPDYLKDEACPHCQQVHRPDEPCPNSSVRQHQQQERKWYNHDPNVIHSAQSQVMYHVAPQSARESIEGMGLWGAGNDSPYGDDREDEGETAGTYLYSKPELAHGYREFRHAQGEPTDLYEVDVNGVPLERDPVMSQTDQHWMTRQLIPPDRIRRVE